MTRQILVIDDELDICIMLKVVLEQNGFIVNYYSNPILALDEFQSSFYDLVILDMQMSEVNGMQLYREIRKRDIKTKICFLTGSEELFAKSYKFTSVYTFISKPVDNKELIKIVNDVLNSYK